MNKSIEVLFNKKNRGIQKLIAFFSPMKLDRIDLNIEYKLTDSDNSYHDLYEINTLISVLLHCTYVLLCTKRKYTYENHILYFCSASLFCDINTHHVTIIIIIIIIVIIKTMTLCEGCFFPC